MAIGYFLGFDWSDMPSIGTYEKALEVFNHPKRVKREDSDGYRPLRIGDRKKRTTIHMVPNGGIAMRLYETDVVTYYQDGSILLHTFKTKTTGEFADEVLPPGARMQIDWSTRCSRDETYLYTYDATQGSRWDNGGPRYYRFDGETMTIEQDPENANLWRPRSNDFAPVEFIHVDKSLYARTRRQFKLRALEDYFDTNPKQPDWSERLKLHDDCTTQDLMAWIANGDYALVHRALSYNPKESALRFVYSTVGVLNRTYKDYVNYGELQLSIQQERRWGWV